MDTRGAETQRPGDFHTPVPTQSDELDVRAFIAARVAEHYQILGHPLVHLRHLAEQAAEANAAIPELTAMDQKIALLCNDLRECFGREESMVFPAIVRLSEASGVSKCHAGMVRARLRFMMAEQNALLNELSEAGEIARRFLSPSGPCEFCHELLEALESLALTLSDHLRLEQEYLFNWALQREDRLIANLSSADERCL